MSNDKTQQLLDRVAICEVLDRYFHGLDTRDKAMVVSCFSASAHVEVHAGTKGQRTLQGAEAIAANICERAAQRAASNHMPSHRNVTIDGDKAHAETFAIAHLLPDEKVGGKIFVRGLRYKDDLVREPDGWRIQHRAHFGLWQYEATTVAPST